MLKRLSMFVAALALVVAPASFAGDSYSITETRWSGTFNAEPTTKGWGTTTAGYNFCLYPMSSGIPAIQVIFTFPDTDACAAAESPWGYELILYTHDFPSDNTHRLGPQDVTAAMNAATDNTGYLSAPRPDDTK